MKRLLPLLICGACIAQEPQQVLLVNPVVGIKGEGGLSPVIKQNVHTGDNELLVNLQGHICVDNTTTNLIGANGVFTGGWQDITDYTSIFISVLADQDSATDGLTIQYSPNANDISDTDIYSIYANTAKVYAPTPSDRYIRLVYTNGVTPQTKFFLTTILKHGGARYTSHPIKRSISAEDDATLTKTVITGEKPNGEFVNFQSTTAGNFKVSLEEYDEAFDTLPIPAKVSGTKYVSGIGGIDAATEALIFVPWDEHELHDGDLFTFCENVTLGNGATRAFIINVPNTNKWPHMVIHVRSTGEANYVIYEGTTTSSDGTAVSEWNRNRNSTTTNLTQISHTPTITSTGTVFCTEHFGSGQQFGGEARGENEIILKQNTKYLLLLTSEAADNDLTTKLVWYEHKRKN